MSINVGNDKSIPTDAENCYEELANQEEIYLEETEEELRVALTSLDPPAEYGPSTSEDGELNWEIEISMIDANSDPRIAARLDGQLRRAVEELITADLDAAPLSEEHEII